MPRFLLNIVPSSTEISPWILLWKQQGELQSWILDPQSHEQMPLGRSDFLGDDGLHVLPGYDCDYDCGHGHAVVSTQHQCYTKKRI